MSTSGFRALGRGVACAALLGANWCASCGGAEEPAAPATHAQAPADASNATEPAAVKAATPPAVTNVASEPSKLEPAKTPPPIAEPKAAPEQPKPAAPAPVAQAPVPAAPVAPKPAPQEPSAPKPPQIPLGELLTQRDLWPAKVALTQPLTIERGVTLPVGHELSVYEFNGSYIALDTGTDIFECEVAKTDALERAYATKAALTPEQLAIDDNVLPSRSELWPLRVKLTRRLQFGNGKELPVGREVALRTVTIGWLNLFDSELNDHFQAEAFETDVIARARQRLALPEAERTPFFVRSLAAALEPREGAQNAQVEEADYVIVYRMRTGCTRCAAFAPELAKFYESVKAEHPRFEAVFLSDDKSGDAARALFAKEKLPGRAVVYERKLEAADIATRLTGELLPLVYVIHKSGTIVAQNQGSGGSPTASDTLAALEAKLREPR